MPVQPEAAVSLPEVLLDRYEVGELLGSGMTSQVFRGTDRVLDRRIALKVLRPEFTEDEEFITRFRREAHASAGLQHPNIAGVNGAETDGGVHFLVMELVEGWTLGAYLTAHGPLDPAQAAAVGAGVCAALEHAHGVGVRHGDIEPGNIMLTTDGRVKVTDFGVAQAVSTHSANLRGALSNAHYLSPERAQGIRTDARSDLYSLGCCLYEMLTGRPPFLAETAAAVAYMHVNEPAPSLLETTPEAPPELAAVVHRCLAKRPADRQQLARELRQELEPFCPPSLVATQPLLMGTWTDRAVDAALARSVRTETTGGALEPAPPTRARGRSRRLARRITVAGVAGLALAGSLIVGQMLQPEETTQVVSPPASSAGSSIPPETTTAASSTTEPETTETSETAETTTPAPAQTAPERPPAEVGQDREADGPDQGEGAVVPSTARVPAVSENPTEAIRQLTEAGFTSAARVVAVDDPAQDNQVIAQDPPAGTEAPGGSRVTITIGTLTERPGQ